jgi:hypothetical protein
MPHAVRNAPACTSPDDRLSPSCRPAHGMVRGRNRQTRHPDRLCPLCRMSVLTSTGGDVYPQKAQEAQRQSTLCDDIVDRGLCARRATAKRGEGATRPALSIRPIIFGSITLSKMLPGNLSFGALPARNGPPTTRNPGISRSWRCASRAGAAASIDLCTSPPAVPACALRSPGRWTWPFPVPARKAWERPPRRGPGLTVSGK